MLVFLAFFVVVAGKWFWPEIVGFFVVVGKFYYDQKKKIQSSVWRVVLLCQFLVLAITTGKKKVTVLCLAGCAVVSVFGSGDYDRKKKFQSSVWRVVLLCQFF